MSDASPQEGLKVQYSGVAQPEVCEIRESADIYLPWSAGNPSARGRNALR